ncbi:hypothetical protein [Larkinella soli]|uniref:hypothetical protein n=1 Tax=Larkinella soli TaxID=1770527 RepID=UPI000FFC324C|nr:hypothetical protein [Larkinella soli]
MAHTHPGKPKTVHNAEVNATSSWLGFNLNDFPNAYYNGAYVSVGISDSTDQNTNASIIYNTVGGAVIEGEMDRKSPPFKLESAEDVKNFRFKATSGTPIVRLALRSEYY